ncbi:pickpocket protein 28-like [Uranotaenia lowii]|uniref:pickpocket protein 28-like n=1 Tax=Uranotaenia lowii TaxID=190385 RepID=UPI0024798141|nr:pickpocket protein 28-like [Uranotaenia lowii]
MAALKPFPAKKHRVRPLKRLMDEFCSNSAIHGVKYFVGAHRALIEKTWWILVFLVSLAGCGILIRTIFFKWLSEPVILTYAQKAVPVFMIPFPAVTICPETKAKMRNFNFTKMYHTTSRANYRANETDEQLQKLEVMLQICEFVFNRMTSNRSFDDDCVKLMRRLAIPPHEIFILCRWRNKAFNCFEEFSITLTDVGICFTFNSAAEKDIMRVDQLIPNQRYMSAARSSNNWSLEEGYPQGASIHTYPRRVIGAGITSGLSILLKSNISDFDYLCGNSFQGFRALLHMPTEYPLLINQHFRIPLEHETTVAVLPQVIITSESVQSYQPKRRKCFFDHERYLRFFRVYTQSNCEHECLANFTIRRCGCVAFYMPRAPGVRICGLGLKKCYQDAMIELLEMEANLYGRSQRFVKECSCLPGCTSILYNTEISQASFDWTKVITIESKLGKALEGTQLAHLQVFFKDSRLRPIERNELYGSTDLIANCGGLLGLFMGVSLLSLMEIMYFCAVRPLIKWLLPVFVEPKINHKLAKVNLLEVQPIHQGNEFIKPKIVVY